MYTHKIASIDVVPPQTNVSRLSLGRPCVFAGLTDSSKSANGSSFGVGVGVPFIPPYASVGASYPAYPSLSVSSSASRTFAPGPEGGGPGGRRVRRGVRRVVLQGIRGVLSVEVARARAGLRTAEGGVEHLLVVCPGGEDCDEPDHCTRVRELANRRTERALAYRSGR